MVELDYGIAAAAGAITEYFGIGAIVAVVVDGGILGGASCTEGIGICCMTSGCGGQVSFE